MSGWEPWIGRTEHHSDRIDPAMVTRWLATLDRAAPEDGTVPQGLHWCLCLPDAPTSKLGSDGHPVRNDDPNGFLPPLALPRRMWASSQIEFVAPLRSNETVNRTSRVLSIVEKDGRTGQLVFVDVVHETAGETGVALRETQSIVYRDAADFDAELSPPEPGNGRFNPDPWDTYRMLVPDQTLLFRYSALTFNSHRIHYDLPYARDVERYRGLVVHGPLTATLLLDLAAREYGDNALKTFRFRAISPAICGEKLYLAMREQGDDIELSAYAADGRQVMAGAAQRFETDFTKKPMA